MSSDTEKASPRLGALKGIGISAVALLALGLATPQRAHAIFGFGDIVFDPSAWAELVSSNATFSEQLAQAVKILQNGVQMYQFAMREATFIQNKQPLQAVVALSNHAAASADPDGETSGWDEALSSAGGVARAGMAWQNAMRPGTSLQARVNLANSMGINAMLAIGACSEANQQNDGPLGMLEGLAASADPAHNTRAAHEDVADMAAVQRLRMDECRTQLEIAKTEQGLLTTLEGASLGQTILDRDQQTIAIRANNPVYPTHPSDSLVAHVE